MNKSYPSLQVKVTLEDADPELLLSFFCSLSPSSNNNRQSLRLSSRQGYSNHLQLTLYPMPCLESLFHFLVFARSKGYNRLEGLG